MPLITLPPELLLMIAKNLDAPSDLNSFSQASKRLYPIVSDVLYRGNITVDDCSALFWAARQGMTGTITRILGYGVDVDTRDDTKILLQHGADLTTQPAPEYPDIPDAYGPAIFEAAREGRNVMVEYLLDNGTDVNQQRAGELIVSMLEAAISGGHSSTVQLLNRDPGMEHLSS
ncbi:hypothetical protein BDW74DRAFT_174071 [Aspergillus multicolor]|uniref:uncharacterized protein n=1 Tax=Aspergillus multicolor TaxID=41759 RepID=UPI003CCDC578